MWYVPTFELATPAAKLSGNCSRVDNSVVWSHMGMKWLIAMGFGEQSMIWGWYHVLIYVAYHGGMNLPLGKSKLQKMCLAMEKEGVEIRLLVTSCVRILF